MGKALGVIPSTTRIRDTEVWSLFWLTFKPCKSVHHGFQEFIHLALVLMSHLLSVLCRTSALTSQGSLQTISGVGTSRSVHQNPSDKTLPYNKMANCFMCTLKIEEQRPTEPTAREIGSTIDDFNMETETFINLSHVVSIRKTRRYQNTQKTPESGAEKGGSEGRYRS